MSKRTAAAASAAAARNTANHNKKSTNPQRNAEETMLLSGLTAFHTHHQAAYKQRWLTSLYPSLLLQHPSVALINRYIGKRHVELIRERLRQQGAVRWERGNPEEVECWRFDAVIAEKQAKLDADAAGKVEIMDSMQSMSINDDVASTSQQQHRFHPPQPIDLNTSTLLPYYLLDAASVLAVDALTVGPHHSVLDLCAAPGGKSIVIAQALDLLDATLPPSAPTPSGLACPPSAYGSLHANEPQANRRVRLQTVLSEYLPASLRKNRTRIEVTGWDATKIALPAARYDRVLVDAPCSSDRHVLSNHAELAEWSTKRILLNAARQEMLLFNALKALKVGGICVYATCSLSKMENDSVIANVLEKLKKNKGNMSKKNAQRIEVEVLKMGLIGGKESAVASSASASASSTTGTTNDEDVLYLPMGEPTKYGWMVLPDQILHNIAATSADASSSSSTTSAASSSSTSTPSTTTTPVGAIAVPHGYGPLYFARLKRVGGEQEDKDEEESEEDEASDAEEDETEAK